MMTRDGLFRKAEGAVISVKQELWVEDERAINRRLKLVSRDQKRVQSLAWSHGADVFLSMIGTGSPTL